MPKKVPSSQKKDKKQGKPLKNFQIKKNKPRKKRKKIISIFIWILVIALIFLVPLILFEAGILDYNFNFNAQPQKFSVPDECSLIVGNLIHTIANEDTCELKCKTHCTQRELSFQSSEFSEVENDCNTCNCYCK